MQRLLLEIYLVFCVYVASVLVCTTKLFRKGEPQLIINVVIEYKRHTKQFILDIYHLRSAGLILYLAYNKPVDKDKVSSLKEWRGYLTRYMAPGYPFVLLTAFIIGMYFGVLRATSLN